MNPATFATLHGQHWIGLGVVALALAWLVAAIALRLAGGPRKSGRKAAPRQPRPDGLVEIYVGNLAAFAKFGVVHSARVVTHPSGKSKGYGFVLMPHRSEAEIACKALDGAEVMGRKIRANEARGASK